VVAFYNVAGLGEVPSIQGGEGMGVSENALLAGARGYLLRGTVLAALTLLMTLIYTNTARAEIFTVTNLNDSGPGSLRAAINAAEANAGADEIAFDDGVSGAVTLASTLPIITDAAGLTIDGGGGITVSGNNAVQIFMVGEGADLTLRNLIISDGAAVQGSAIFNEGGTLEVSNSTISDNHADDYGGGIFNAPGGTVEVINSTISDNTAADIGGGIRSFGTLKVINSTISGNDADFAGGGSDNDGGTLEVINSTISDNNASLDGGAINGIGTSTIINSTISGNSASFGGGISGGATVTLQGTIVANSEFGGNCAGQPTDGGYNIDDDGTCGFAQATGSLPNTDPLLDPEGLKDNGGPTPTIALLPESPAVDLVGQDACPPPSTDQRGVERPQGEACDAGAFELVQGPQTKADCKKAGWEEFGFKNQGQCIASLQKKQSTNG
jgi:hypothetical protein